MNSITAIEAVAEYLPTTTEPVLNIATSYSTTAPVLSVPMLSLDFVRLETPQESGVLPTGESGVLPIAKAFYRLNDLGRLERDWDSFGSSPPSREALDAARDLIVKVGLHSAGGREEAAVPFAIVPLSSGGVQIEWRGNRKAIEVEVYEDGKFGFLQIIGNGDDRSFEERDSATESEVLERISSVVTG